MKTTKNSIDKIGLSLIFLLLLPACFFYSAQLLDPLVPARMVGLSLGLLAFILGLIFFYKRTIRFGNRSFLGLYLLLYAFFLGSIMLGFFVAVNKGEVLYILARSLFAPILVVVFAVFIRENFHRFRWLSRAVVVIGLINAVIGILQYTKLGFLGLEPVGTSAPYGLMANRNLLASFLGLSLPFCLYLLLTDERKWQRVSGVSFAMLSICLLLTMTRSIWLAVVLAFVGVSLMLLFLRKKIDPENFRRWFRLVGILLLLGGLGLAGSMSLSKSLRSSFTKRLALVLNYSEDKKPNSINERFVAWEVSLRMAKTNPIIGVGAGNWKTWAPHHEFFSLHRFGNREHLPMRPHNIYLNTLSELGGLGLLFYLAMGGLLFFVLLGNITNSSDFSLFYCCVLFGLCIYFIDAIFSFADERIAHTVLFSLLIGALFAKVPDHSTKQIKISRPVLYSVALLLVGVLAVGLSKFHLDKMGKQMTLLNTQKQFSQAAKVSQQHHGTLLSLNSSGDPAAFSQGNAVYGNGDLPKAISFLEQARKQAPYHPRVLNNLAYFYTEQGATDQAIEVYQQLIKVSPERLKIAGILAEIYYKKGDMEACCALLLSSGLYQTEKYGAFWAKLCGE